MLWKTPGFTAVVVLTLALGIGANTAIFTVINAVLLRPVPYSNPSNLVLLTIPDKDQQSPVGCLSYPHFKLISERSRAFAGISGFTSETFNLTSPGDAVQLQSARVSSNFFDVLGTTPSLGRSFVTEEGKPGGNLTVMISDRLWHQRFQSREDIIGQSITLDSKIYTIAGVLPPNFEFGLLGTRTDLWVPRIDELNIVSSQQIQGGVCYLNAIARLAPGVPARRGQAEMNALDHQYLQEYPKLHDANPDRLIQVASIQEALVGNLRPTFLLLAGAVALVLLIACANVASLLLTRALARRGEVAVRTALGATRADLIRQLFAESMLLAVIGGALGVAVSSSGTELLARMAANVLPRANEIESGIDLRVLAFAAGVSLFTGLLFGLAPSLQFSKPNLSGIIREQGRGAVGSRLGNGARNLLVAGQVALSVVLLIGTGLLIRSFVRLATQPPGFEPHGVLTMNVALPPGRYSALPQMIEFYDQALTRIQALPGVQSAAAASALPVNVSRLSPVLIEGQPVAPLIQRPVIIIQTFTPSYLDAMKIPLIRGRFFSSHDTRESAPVVIVNESLAKKFFPHQDPIGKHVWLGRRTSPAEIVGVIGDVKNVSLSAPPQPELDLPYPQLAWASMNLIIRTKGEPNHLANAVRQCVAEVDKQLPVTAVQTLEELLATARSQPRIIMTLLTAFSASALVLAIVGLYGVISYSVSQRTKEIGLRIILGASRRDVMTLILKHGALVALVGIVGGIAPSFAATRLLTTFVYGITPTDPLTFVLVPLLLLVLALFASYIPAWRAIGVDPARALRAE